MKSPVYLNAMRAFEASARHQSFAAAAEELNVTPAAVGQLVRSLEEWLGIPLFHRGTSGRARLIATDAAERALPDIRAGFDRLSLGLERLKELSTNGIITVTVSPAFAAKWLMPRIDKFQTKWPDTDVRLDTSLKLADFVAQGIDIGVRYGGGTWPGLRSELLMSEEIYPVCSPEFLKSNRKLKKYQDLIGLTLIDDLSVDSNIGFATWDTWLKSVGCVGVKTKRAMRINNSAAVLQAAIDGHGIALARSVMAQDDVSAGRLVRLFPEVSYQSELAYYIVYKDGCGQFPKLIAFRDWLLDEARK